jgi:peptidoglycan/LPS O-acetylase OafA/YrhL
MGQTILNVCAGLIVAHCVERPDFIVGRFLNHWLLAQIGVLSYSLYLWQQMFLNRAGTWAIQRFPLNLACVAVAAWVSYYLIERPFLGLRLRFSGRRPAPLAPPGVASA